MININKASKFEYIKKKIIVFSVEKFKNLNIDCANKEKTG